MKKVLLGLLVLSPLAQANSDIEIKMENGDVSIIPKMAECSALYNVVSKKTKGVNKTLNLASSEQLTFSVNTKFDSSELFETMKSRHEMMFGVQIETDSINPMMSNVPDYIKPIFLGCHDYRVAAEKIYDANRT